MKSITSVYDRVATSLLVVVSCAALFASTVYVITNSTPRVNGAQFISQNVPDSMTPGQAATVTVTYKNIGTTTWLKDKYIHRLGSQSPRDNDIWRHRRVNVPNDVLPGQTVTFNFPITAPTSTGVYDFQWQMLEEFVQWFGDKTPLKQISVQPALVFPDECLSSYRKIFISTSGSATSTGTLSNPVNSLDRAYQLAKSDSAPGYCLLLKAGDVFSKFTSHKFEDDIKANYAFIWDLEKPLVMASYGQGVAILRETSGSLVPSALVIAGVSKDSRYTSPVVIKNLQFEKWQARVISIRYHDNVKVINNVFRDIGTKYLGDNDTSSKDDGKRIYGDGVIYPKDASNLVFEGNAMTNMINNTKGSDNKYDDIHAFYLTRVEHVTIQNNIISYSSGPAVKPGKGSSDIKILNNKFNYIAPYIGQDNYDQLGFIRLDGDSSCPEGITIENNEFKYPYCPNSNCNGKKAQRCSQVKCSGICKENIKPSDSGAYSNTSNNFGDKSSILKWTNNVFNGVWSAQ